MIYTVTFNPAIDYVIHLSGSLKLGGINRNESEEFQYGGKGINVSLMLARLDLPAGVVGAVVGDCQAEAHREVRNKDEGRSKKDEGRRTKDE